MPLNSVKGLFRVIAFLEGVSYILLLFIAVPLKYWGGEEKYVKILGMPHGLLFILYLILYPMRSFDKIFSTVGNFFPGSPSSSSSSP